MKNQRGTIYLPPGEVLADDPAASFVPTSDYALRALPYAFENIESTLEELFSRHPGVKAFDVTAFYSQRQPDLAPKTARSLVAYNRSAFSAAIKKGGLVAYYQGELIDNLADEPPDPALDLDFTPDCLSFCIWESRKQALSGAAVAAHREAASKVSLWYTNFAIRKLTILTGISFVKTPKTPESILFQPY